MAKLFLLLLIIFLSFVTSIPIEYESLSVDCYNSNSKSDDNQLEINGETDSLSADISQNIYKRQIESDGESIQLSLSDIIENIEDSLLDSALGASNIYEILTSDTITKKYNDYDDDINSEKNIEHIVAKREDDDDDDNNKSKSSSSDADQKSKLSSLDDDNKSKSKSSSSDEDDDNKSDTVLTHFTAREVPISDDHAAHVAVDRVTVFVANQGFLPMIPSFDLHHSGVQHESIKEIIEDAKNSKSNSSSEEENNDNTESTTNDAESTVNDVSTEKLNKNNTTKAIEVFEEIKEKVAEVEAEPIILSARV